MQDSFDFQSLVKKYPELPYSIFAILSYCASVFFAITEIGGTVEFYSITIHTVSTPLWAIFGLLSIYFLYTAFFDMWIYAIHLILAYYLTGAGIIALYVFFGDLTIRIFSIVLIVTGIGFVGYFIYRIGNVRSYRIINSSDQEAARERFSLHSWYIFPFVFFAIAAVSFLDLGYWYENPDHSPIFHFLAEFTLILTVVYVLWKPENVLFYGTKEAEDEIEEGGILAEPFRRSQERSIGERGLGEKAGDSRLQKGIEGTGDFLSSAESRIKKHRKIENCPGFDSPPVTMRKSCPNCGDINSFDWCTQSEEYLINCPQCERKTYHGRKVCIRCKSRLPETVTCAKCSNSFPVRRFKEVA